MHHIISEDILEKLICSNCNNYLSYGDARLTAKEVICGRCNQDQTVLPLFDSKIKTYLFPCINRFDNCKELLRHSQVIEHERTCSKKANHKCIKCEYDGNGCQVYHHFLKEHPKSVLKYPVFNINVSQNETNEYIYRENNSLWKIKYQVQNSDNSCKIFVNPFGNIEEALCQVFLNAIKTDGTFLVSNKQQLLEIKVEMKYLPQHNSKVINCHVRFIKTSRFLKRYGKTVDSTNADQALKNMTSALNKSLFPKLKCSSCACYVIPPIKRCPLSHVQCENCASSYCKDCEDIVNWSRAPDLEVFHEFLPLPCRWTCSTVLQFSNLRQHEANCDQRQYQCPVVSCLWKGSLNSLYKHWHHSIPIFANEHNIFGYQEKVEEFYLTHKNEIFYCRIDAMTNKGRYVHVRQVSNVAPLSGTYQPSIKLEQHCGQHLRQFIILRQFGDIGLIPRSTFNFFGDCKNYKIIFHFAPIVY